MKDATALVMAMVVEMATADEERGGDGG